MTCFTRTLVVIAFIVILFSFISGKNNKKQYLESKQQLQDAKEDLISRKQDWDNFILKVEEDISVTKRKITESKRQLANFESRLDSEIGRVSNRGLSRTEWEELLDISSPVELDKAISKKVFRHFPSDYRLSNGNVVRNNLPETDSRSSLLLNNGLPEDAYVKLLRGNVCVASFYVQGEDLFRFSGIPDGVYTVMYSIGFGWDKYANDFNRGRKATRYDRDIVYETGPSRYLDITLTLHKVVYGNESTSDMSPDEFDKY